jgi:hypothetical protein
MFEASQHLKSIESSLTEISVEEENKLSSSNQSFSFQVMTTFARDFEKILYDFEQFDNFFRGNDFKMTKTVIQKLNKNKNQVMWNEFQSMHHELFVKRSKTNWNLSVEDFYAFAEKLKSFFRQIILNPKRFLTLNVISEILLVCCHSKENNLYLLAAVFIWNFLLGGRLMLPIFEDFLTPIHSAFAANFMKTIIYLPKWISFNTGTLDFTKSEMSGLQIATFSILFHAIATILLLRFYPKFHLKLLVAAAMAMLCLQLQTTFDIWNCWSVSPFSFPDLSYSARKIEIYPLQMQVLLFVTCCINLYYETMLRSSCKERLENCKAARFLHSFISHALRIFSLFAILIFFLPSLFFLISRLANVELYFWPYKLVCD